MAGLAAYAPAGMADALLRKHNDNASIKHNTGHSILSLSEAARARPRSLKARERKTVVLARLASPVQEVAPLNMCVWDGEEVRPT